MFSFEHSCFSPLQLPPSLLRLPVSFKAEAMTSRKRPKCSSEESTILGTGNIYDYERNANKDKKKQATKRFDLFMSKYADNFTTDHPDKPGIASGKFNSEYTFDKLIYEDCCNSDLFGVFFNYLAFDATYLNDPNEKLSYAYTIQLASTLKEHIVNGTICRSRYFSP